MVSKAREDFPEPERPVITVRLVRGISKLMFLRLCWRAPRTTSLVKPMVVKRPLQGSPGLQTGSALSGDTEAKVTFDDNRGTSGGSRKSGRKRVRTSPDE